MMKFHINHTISSPAPTSLPVGGRLTTLPRPRLLGSQAAALAADKQHHGEATQQQQRQAFEQLAEWLTEKGGSVSGITAGDCQMGPVTVRGLIATQPIAAGTPVLSVPIGATLRDDAAAAPYPGAPWNACLAAQLLQERAKGTSSPLWPYLATLPAGCCSPLMLGRDQLLEVQYGPAVAAIQGYQQAVHEAYMQYCRAVQQQQEPEQQWQPCSWEEWVWAVHMVQSRSIRLAITGCKVMIPGIDLLNHGGAAANGQLVLGKASWQVEGEPAVCFVTSKGIPAGEQVLWSYGQRGNDDFFVYHGFVLGDNPDEDVVLFAGVQELVYWAMENMPPLRWLKNNHQKHHVLGLAEAAANRAAQAAAAYCSSGAIQGTSSSVLTPSQPLVQLFQEQRQHKQPQQPPLHQHHQQQQRVITSQRDANSTRSQAGGGTAAGGSRTPGAVPGPSETAVLGALRNAQLHRRLASLRLHLPEWGAASCPASAPELALRCDGCVDVRLPAVLAALADAANVNASDAANASGGGVVGSEAGSGAGVSVGSSVANLLAGVLVGRCGELLRGFGTSIQEDQQQLQRAAPGAMGEDEQLLMCAVIQYRLAKKQLLQQFEDQ